MNEKDESITVKGGAGLPARLLIGADGPKFDVKQLGENRTEVPAALLAYLPSPEFAVVGYGLSTEGWLDPVAFLKTRGADANPAPFEGARRR